MLRIVAGVTLVFASVALAAQNRPSAGPAASDSPEVKSTPGGLVIILPSIEGSCPVAMHASQGVWDHTIRVREGDRERVGRPIGQRISLNLKNSGSNRIVSATVRVRGWNGKNRILSTPTDSNQRWNAVKTIHAKFVEENDGSVSGDLWIEGFTAVDSLQLMDATYADGRIWNVPSSKTCRVQPDPLMLITER